MKNLIKLLTIVALMFVSHLSFAKQFNALLFTKTAGWHHKSINAGVTAIQTLARQHHFDVEWHEEARHFNDENLARFDVVIFLSTTGDVLNEQQQGALKRFINAGKGFVGIHAAADTEYDWPWFGKLVGHRFKIHPEIQTAKMLKLNNDFPGMFAFAQAQLWTEEWYEFSEAESDNLNYILRVDESTFAPEADWGHVKGKGMGDFHPIAWYHEFDGGRSFYTGLGHMAGTYELESFRMHLYGGIFWAASGNNLKGD